MDKVKKMIAIPKDHIGYEEYPYVNWIKGEEYQAIEHEDLIQIADEKGSFFNFAGRAKERLHEVFDFKGNTE